MLPIVPNLVSLITLNWSHYHDLTGPFIRYVGEWTPEPFELIVVDQGSVEEDRVALAKDARSLPWLKVVQLEENTGFPKGNNIGLGYASGEYIVFINNDIIISGDWLSPLLDEVKANPKSIVGMSKISGNAGWNEYERNGSRFHVLYLEGWLILCHRNVVDEVGVFDEAFGIGSLEDLDWCWRANKAGYELVEIPSLPLVHLRGKTVYDGSGRIDQWQISMANYELMKHRVAEGYYD